MGKTSNSILIALGTLLFVNGVVHIAASLLTVTYSPGTISGVIVYIPLGILIFKNIFPLLPEQQRYFSVATGIILHIIISIIAFNI
jgi:uncharacterized membrane protein SirB2